MQVVRMQSINKSVQPEMQNRICRVTLRATKKNKCAYESCHARVTTVTAVPYCPGGQNGAGALPAPPIGLVKDSGEPWSQSISACAPTDLNERMLGCV